MINILKQVLAQHGMTCTTYNTKQQKLNYKAVKSKNLTSDANQEGMWQGHVIAEADGIFSSSLLPALM